MDAGDVTTVAVRDRLAADVRRDLGLPRKQLQPRYLYDALGSRLFEAICALPEYRITRAEQRLLAAHAGEMGAGLAAPVTIVELGAGSGEKLAQLIEPLMQAGVPSRVELVDVSATALDLASRTLSRWANLPVTGHETTYENGLDRVAAHRVGEGAMLAAFLGSNIGNLDPAASLAFVVGVRSALRPGDRFLLGTDLVKPEAQLVIAYDDPLGVTAAFNLNVLARLNRELGANFDLDRFAHRAVWNAVESRMEMHLESLRAQTVAIPGAECSIHFAEGESIWTESSYKYRTDGVRELGAAVGLAVRGQWVDERDRFALTAFEAR
jgi:dimethylhistidine N-methyltransferase